jgi:hypothetical protein
MICPRFSHTSSFIHLICFLVCYSLVAPLPAFTIPGVISTSAAAPAEPPVKTKTNTPRKDNQAAQKARWRDGELLVHFKEHAPASKLNALLRANGAQWNGRFRGESGIERLTLAKGSDPEVVASALRASEWVDYAEPNYLITADQTTTQSATNDPRFSEQWALRSTGTPQAWAITTGSKQTVIAIIDSGIDFIHPDLSNNEWDNTLEKANNLDNDGNGFNSDLHGWDFITDSGTVIDEHGHGTAIAGIIAAEGNNATGTSGVMWRAGLMSLRVLDSTGWGDVAHAVEAIDYAVNNGAQVINCSWGMDDVSLALREAINRAAQHGVVVITSAGNDNRDIETTPRYPASFDLPNLISVASTDNADQLTSFSNRGTQHVSIAAPGEEILTTRMGGDYRTISGTSASTAFVTGVVGLVKSLRPWLGAARAREMILHGARQVSTLIDKVASKGIISAAGSLETLNTLPQNEGLDESTGNNGGEHGNNENGRSSRSNQPNNRPDGSNSNSNRDGHEFSVTPLPRTQGAPGTGLPDLDLLRRQQPTPPKAAPPVPSTRCAHHNPQCDKVKQKAAIESPVDLLAWTQNLPSTDSYVVDNSHQVSDTPFKLVWIPRPLLTAMPLLLPPQPQTTRTNVALSANGGVALAQNYTQDAVYPGLHFQPAYANDGVHYINPPAGDQYWRDENGLSSWLEIDFNSTKVVDEVDVYTTGDYPAFFSEPTAGQTFTQYGVTAFSVQYWNGSAWAAVSGGNITANNLVWKKLNFSGVSTNKIRVVVNTTVDGVARIAEVEAWGTPATPTNVALASNGGVATASSTTPDSEFPGLTFPASGVNDGDRKGLNWEHGGGWRDGTANSYPDWIEVDFNSNKSIGEIDVFTIQDNYSNPVEPTEAQTFTLNGVTDFDVQYWA